MEEDCSSGDTIERLITRTVPTLGAVVRYGEHVIAAEYSCQGCYRAMIYFCPKSRGGDDFMERPLFLELRLREDFTDSGHAIFAAIQKLEEAERIEAVINVWDDREDCDQGNYDSVEYEKKE